MENFAEFKNRVIEYLGGLTAFAGAAIIPAFGENARTFQAEEPVITVEISGAELAESGLGRYFGGDKGKLGMAAAITLKFGLRHKNAEGCCKLFESLLDALFASPMMSVQKIARAGVSYDAKSAACVMYAEAELRAVWLSEGANERLFENIRLSNAMDN